MKAKLNPTKPVTARNLDLDSDVPFNFTKKKILKPPTTYQYGKRTPVVSDEGHTYEATMTVGEIMLKASKHSKRKSKSAAESKK